MCPGTTIDIPPLQRYEFIETNLIVEGGDRTDNMFLSDGTAGSFLRHSGFCLF
jgi:hypothetical protein